MGVNECFDGWYEGNQHGHGTLEDADCHQVMHDQFNVDSSMDHPNQHPDHVSATEPNQHGPDECDIGKIRRLVPCDGDIGND